MLASLLYSLLPWMEGMPLASSRSLTHTIVTGRVLVDNDREASISLFSEEQIATSYLDFTGAQSLVNADLEAIPVDLWHRDSPPVFARIDPVNCSHADYALLKAEIDGYLAQLTNESVPLSTTSYILDAISLRAPYLACQNHANSLLRSVSRTVTKVSI